MISEAHVGGILMTDRGGFSLSDIAHGNLSQKQHGQCGPESQGRDLMVEGLNFSSQTGHKPKSTHLLAKQKRYKGISPIVVKG